ncbi:MAG: hypothetical protein JW737_01965 [Acidobacteria bacterium]|nr:hypothetical protein [Acidobacteriota bacterium]
MTENHRFLRIDVLNVEINNLDYERTKSVALFCAFYSMGRAYRTRIVLNIEEQKKMTEKFFRKLVAEIEEKTKRTESIVADQFLLANRERIEEELRDFFLKIRLGQEKSIEGRLSKFDLAMISTNRLDFYNPEYSLNNKSLKEKVEILLKKTRSDINDGFFVPAKDLLEKILILDRDNTEAYALKGACHRELGEIKDAEFAFKKWLELSQPDDAIPYFNYGDILIRQKKYYDAEKIYESYLKIFPNEFNGLLELAQVRYLGNGDYLSVMDKLNKIDPEHFRNEILGSFIFSLDSHADEELLDSKLAAAFLDIEPELVRNLTDKDIIPHEMVEGEPVFNREELESWAKVINRFNLLDIHLSIKQESIEELKRLRSTLSESIKIKAALSKRGKLTGRQRKKKILEEFGQQNLFDKS